MKVTKRHMTPMFHSRNLEQLMTTFNNNSRELVAQLAEHVDGNPVNILHSVQCVALKTVSQLIFGTELHFDTQSELFEEGMKALEKVPTIFFQRVIKPWLRVDFVFEFLYRKELREICKMMDVFTEPALKIAKSNREKKYGNGSSELSEKSDQASEGILTLIDVYADLQKKYPQFTEKDLRYEIASFYGTGTETVGLAVSTCLLVLAKLQDIQNDIYEEINFVVGPEEDVTLGHITRMQYLDQVYKETLRWANIVPYIIRKTSEELKLSTCTIPAGNTVVVGLAGPHMDPSIYPEPLKFNPERFSPENSTSRGKEAFVPFSVGSRMCIAKTYSEYLIKTMLVHVLRKYRVSTDMDIYNLKRFLMVTLVSSEGYNIKFQNRM